MHVERELEISSIVDHYVDAAMSCPDLCVRYDVEVREFVVLACLRDQGVADTDRIARSIGLTPTTVTACLASLAENGLVRVDNGAPNKFALSTDGMALVRKASGH